MDTPLRRLRMKRKLTLAAVCDGVRKLFEDSKLDTGNLSRIEKGEQEASTELAERLVRFYGTGITEIKILYPERFPARKKNGARQVGADMPEPSRG